jgi:hypothetical protein
VTSIPIDELDRDGALWEAEDEVAGDSRADFLKKAMAAGGGLAGGGALLGLLATEGRAQTATDVSILNFALTLEELEAAFYREAVAGGALTGRTLRFARVTGAHEDAHVAFLRQALGSAAIARPQFNFMGTTTNSQRFIATAVTLEETGVAAYKGQAPLIETPAVLGAALTIHSVEARHAAWVRRIAGMRPVIGPADAALTREQVLAAVGATGFIVG